MATAKTAKVAKTTKTKTTTQRVAAVRKTILADIRTLDKARRVLSANEAVLATALTTADADTRAQLEQVQKVTATGIAVLTGALEARAAKLVGTYTAN